MSTLPEAMRSLTQVLTGKLQDFTNEVENVHMLWLEEIQQEAQRMFSSNFITEPELMPKTPSQKRTNRRKRISTELNDTRNKRRFSKGKRSNLRRSSIQTTLNLISENVVITNPPISSPEVSVSEEPVRRTRRNKAAVAVTESEPVKRSTRNKGAAKAKEEDIEGVETVNEAPQTPEAPKNVSEVKESSSSSSPVQTLVSQAVVKIPSAERLSAEKLIGSGPSPGRCASKMPIATSGAQASSRTSVRHSLVLRRSLVGLRHSMTQEAVRRASRRSFLKKKARQGNSTCSSSVSGDVSMDVEMEENDIENKIEQIVTVEKPAELVAENITEAQTPPPQDVKAKSSLDKAIPLVEVEMQQETPPAGEHCRFTRSMARLSETGNDVKNDGGKKSQDEPRSSRSGSKRRAAESAAVALSTPKKKQSPPKKAMTGITHSMRFLQTVQKNQLLMMTPGSLGRSSIMKSFIKQTGKTDVKLSSGSVERERQKWDALNKKIEQENERKLKIEEERKKKQEEMKRKRDERVKRVVEARVKVEKEKEQEKKKKIEEKMAQQEKKNDMLRVERLAEEKAKKKVASKRQEELELRRKQEEAARKKKLQQAEEEERRLLELQAKRKAEEEREKARKQAEAARALELKKEQERERERQAAAERERLEREKAIALQKELEKAAREKERRELEEKRRMEEEQRKAEEERAAKQKLAAAAATVHTSVVKMPVNKALNTTITHNPALNITVDIENSVMKTPVSKGANHNMTVDKGAGLNVTVDVEQSPQSYQITPKGKKIDVLLNPEDYGMDQNSDDSTDDESAPRKPIPSWAEGMQLQQAIMKRYYDPLDLDAYFGVVEQPKLEKIFSKTKPRFFKRTSSAVWHSPPRMGAMPN
ncbi:inner centromere protein A isoform X1 [Astyanax mexicanus]|uniref:inner centromere protein A isoform X1 n=1 Tax=Astyanax mexicanus TaxID=7994 RepID=UPI0020CB5F64|nr:inner centromere protein A isoform X1 [Astyanax mexicanus]